MSNIGETISFRVGTLNTRGFRTVKKRKGVMRQAKTHCDLLMLQDTHMDGQLAKDVAREWKGPWAFADRSTNSGGVAMHLSNKSRFLSDDPDAFEDGNGSLLGRTVVAGPMTLYIISAYAPCCSGSTQASNLTFLKKLEKLIAEKQAKGLEVIVAGDLNFIRDTHLDADGGNPVVHKGQADWLDTIEESLGLIDSFRFFRPNEKMYTWSPSGPNTKRLFRRLDYILCSKQMLERATDTLIVPVPSSDHRFLGINFIIGKEKIGGPGLWRHNDNMLKNDEYVSAITKCIDAVKKQTYSSASAKWDYCKFKIRELALEWGKKCAKERRREKKMAEQKYAEGLESNLDEESLSALRQTLQKIFEEEDDVIRFRAGIDNVEKGEKITPYFFRTIEQNRKESNIKRLVTEEYPTGTITREETMQAIEGHFKHVFTDKEKNAHIPEGWWNGLEKLPEDMSKELDSEVTLNEITTALFKLMKEGKSPGNDGLTVAFYRGFWPSISGMVIGSLKEGWAKGKLSNSQRQSVIRLIEKKGKDLSKMNGWRPISLLNIDAKLFSKVLANRLRRICKVVVGEEQLAYMENIDIHEGHLVINKVLELARSKNIKGLMTTVDFKGAFDSVRHKFIWKTLEAMGVGPNLISLLKCLFNETKSAVLNFGTTTGFVDLERSCRQGDPVSAYLFIIVMEVLLNQIRRQGVGFKVCEMNIWGSAFADDLTIFSKTNKELASSLQIISDFKKVSGLEINVDKSEVLELNYTYDETLGIPKVTQAKITGIWFSMDNEIMLKLNWDDVLSKVAGKFNMWKGRHLSEIGKSTVIRAQIAPVVLYVGSIVPLPTDVEKELSKMTFKFIGNGGEKESRALLMKSMPHGGLGIPNWRIRCKSAMALWVVKACNSKKPWANIFEEPGVNWKSVNALASVRSLHLVGGFAGMCVTEWYRTVALLESESNALLWPYIQAAPIATMLKRKCPDLTFDEADLKLPNALNFLENRQVKAAIPNAKQQFSKQKDLVAFKGKQTLHKDLNCVKWSKPAYERDGTRRELGAGRQKDHTYWLQAQLLGTNLTSLCTLKSIYWLHIDHIIPPVHPFRSKIDLDYGPQDWTAIDKEKISTYSRQQAFQWRSTHGKLYGNKQFCGMKVKPIPDCSYCDEKSQSVSHLYLECPYTKQLFACFEKQFKLDRKLTEKEKLLGVDPFAQLTKLLKKKLSILRRLIYQFNHRDEKLRWNMYLEAVDRVYTLEYAIADRNGRVPQHLKHWER